MNVSGKKSLQDIFDEGAKRLEELAQNQKTTLGSTTEAHLDERATFEPEVLKSLEDKAGELEVQIRAHLATGLDRVEKVISAELGETERYIKSLVQNLVLLSRKFSESIDQLKQVSEFNLKNVSTDCHASFSRHSEGVASELKREGALGIGDYQSEAATASERMARAIDESLLSSCNYVNDTNNKLFAAFEKHIGSVKTTMADHEAQLTDDYEKLGQELDGRLAQARNSIETHLEQILSDSQKQSSDAESYLKQIFAALSSGSTGAFDEAAHGAVKDISDLHDSSMSNLSGKTQELSRDMDKLSAEVKGNVGQRDASTRDRGKTLMEAYTNELNDRLESSKSFHKDLESERAELVGEIWKELTDVQNKFEEKLAGLASSTLEKLRFICTEAEGAIASAQQVCINESKSNALSRQDSIQSAADEFLAKVEAKSKAALDGIRGAGGSSETQSATDEAAQKSESDSQTDSGKQKKGDENKQGKKSSKRAANGSSNEEGSTSENGESDEGDEKMSNARPESEGKKRKKSREARDAKDSKDSKDAQDSAGDAS
jgi:hypothetical protein